MKNTSLVIFAWLSLLHLSSAAIFNLTTTDQVIGGDTLATDGSFVVINGAAYTRSDLNSGSGVFRDLYNVGPENGSTTATGYNRVVDGLGSEIPNGFDPFIQIQDIGLDATGDFHVFAIDVNEPGNANALISLDAFNIFTSSAADPDPLPGDQAALEAAFNEVYDIDEFEDNSILLDGRLGGSGSGTADLLIYVPTTVFDGLDVTDNVFVYTEFGGVTNFEVEAGDENVASLTNDLSSSLTSPIPEPTSVVAALISSFMLLGVRRRK